MICKLLGHKYKTIFNVFKEPIKDKCVRCRKIKHTIPKVDKVINPGDWDINQKPIGITYNTTGFVMANTNKGWISITRNRL